MNDHCGCPRRRSLNLTMASSWMCQNSIERSCRFSVVMAEDSAESFTSGDLAGSSFWNAVDQPVLSENSIRVAYRASGVIAPGFYSLAYIGDSPCAGVT